MVLTLFSVPLHPQAVAVVEAILVLVAEQPNQAVLVAVAVEETGERKPLVLVTHQAQAHLKVITVEQEVHLLQITVALVVAVLALQAVTGQELLVVREQQVQHLALPVLA
jgi:hypothetical protein